MCCCFEFLFTVNRCATHKSPTWTEPQQSQRGGNKSCLSCTERGESAECVVSIDRAKPSPLCGDFAFDNNWKCKVIEYVCVCLALTLPPTRLRPALQVRVGNEIQIAAHQAGKLTGGGKGGCTLGTNSLRFSCSIAANKPAASPAQPIFSSNSNCSSNQRLVNNYPCTSKLQTHEIEIRHRLRRIDRETERQRQRPPKQLKMKTRKGSWKKSDGTANLWCPTGSPSSW